MDDPIVITVEKTVSFGSGRPLPNIVSNGLAYNGNDNTETENENDKSGDEYENNDNNNNIAFSDIAFYSRQFLSPFARPRSSTMSAPITSPNRMSQQLQQLQQCIISNPQQQLSGRVSRPTSMDDYSLKRSQQLINLDIGSLTLNSNGVLTPVASPTRCKTPSFQSPKSPVTPTTPVTPTELYSSQFAVYPAATPSKRCSTSLHPTELQDVMNVNTNKVFSPPRRRKTCNSLASRVYSTSDSPDQKVLLLTPPPSSDATPEPLSPVNSAQTSGQAFFYAYTDAQSLLAQGGLSHLPAELLLAIFQFFTPQEICVVGMTCKWWQIVSEQNSLWMAKFQENFQRPLNTMEKFQNANESWKELYIQHYFMDSSYSEIERLLVLFPVTPEYEHDITILLNRVLTYLKHTECISEYILKLEELKNIHVTFGNKTEAAICLLNHSQLISWNADATFGEEYGYPSESHSDRKERLLSNALELFIEGKYWERALIIIRKLRKKYNKDLSRLSDKQQLIKKMVSLSKSEHTCYRSIEGKDSGRFFEEYFFVEFRGKGFPKSVDGKKFIFRGKELEKLGYFVGRLKNRYPGAEVVPKNEKDGQYIHIRPCKPILMPKHIGGSLAASSYNISQVSAHMRRSNYKSEQSFIHNNAKVFFYSMPFKKHSQQQRTDNEFLDLWTCHNYIIAKSTFPGLIRCCEVKSIIEIQKNPLETAIEALEKKNKQLESIFETTKQTKEWSNQLTMALDGVVDAAVSGGVNMYRVFFSLSYIQENNGHLQLLHSLKAILLEQRALLETGLDIHAHYCPLNIKALQTKMERCFEKWKQIISELVVHEINCEQPSLEIARPPSPIKMIDVIDLEAVTPSKLVMQQSAASPTKQILQPQQSKSLDSTPKGWINGQKQPPKRVTPVGAKKPITPISALLKAAALTPSRIPTKSMNKTPVNNGGTFPRIKSTTPLNEVSKQSNNLANQSPITLAHISPIVPLPPKPSTPTTPTITSTNIISKMSSSSSSTTPKSITVSSSARTTSSSSLYKPTLSHLAKKETSPPSKTPSIGAPTSKPPSPPMAAKKLTSLTNTRPQTPPPAKPSPKSLTSTLTSIKKRLSSGSSSSSAQSNTLDEKKLASSSKPPKFKETSIVTSTISSALKARPPTPPPTTSSAIKSRPPTPPPTTGSALKARPPTPPPSALKSRPPTPPPTSNSALKARPPTPPPRQYQQQQQASNNTSLSKPPLSPGTKRAAKSTTLPTGSISQFNYPSDIIESPLIKNSYNKRVALTPLPLSLSLSTASVTAPSNTIINPLLKPRPPTPSKISITN